MMESLAVDSIRDLLRGLAVFDTELPELTGRQSQVLDDPADLDAVLRAAHAAIEADPGMVAPDWTVYGVRADEVEFWQADRDRRHTRLRYTRQADTWARHRLWP